MFQSLFKILKYQIIMSLVFSLFLLLPQARDSMRYMAAYLWGGSLLMVFNFTLLFWVWAIAFTKKKIAPLVIAVVSKYAILGLVLWVLSPLATMPLAFFVLGVLSNYIALVLYGVIGRKKKTENQHVSV